MKPYVYLIGWSNYDLWYYGVRYAKDCNPNDLWVKYFTSSKYVFKKINEIGHPDIIDVLKTFENSVDAINYEEKILKHIYKIGLWHRLLNKNINGKAFVIERTDDWNRKISNALKGKPKTEKHKKALSKYKGALHHGYGIRRSEEEKRKISLGHKKITKWNSIGVYVTPWGEFKSSYDAEINGLSFRTIQTWCKNPEKVINNNMYSHSQWLKNTYPERNDIVGRTLGQVGFGIK